MTMDHRKSLILTHLMKQEAYITSLQLATHVGVSVRTVKSDIAAINKIILPLHVYIESAPHKGYCLKKEEGADLSKLSLLIEGEKFIHFYKTPQDSSERVYYLIRKLLVVDYPLDPADLAEEVFVGEATLTRDLQKVRLILAQHNLKLVTEKNHEVCVQGNEINKRLSIAEFFFHSSQISGNQAEAGLFSEGLNKQEADGIRRILRIVCSEFHMVLSDASLNNLVIHVFVSLARYRFYDFIEAADVSYQSFGDTVEYKAAKRLTEALQEAYGFVIPESEIIYYAMHLQVKRIYDEISLAVPEKIKVNSCISEILVRISEEFGVDFSNDQELHHYLYQHIPLMIIRLKNHMSFRYPKVSENPSSYLFSVKITCVAAEVIGHHYGVTLNIREFEYLVIYFCFAIQKKEEEKPVKIGLYNGGGRAETIMYYDALRRAFYEGKYAVSIVDYNQLIQEPDEIDIYVSTCPIELPEGKQAVLIQNKSYMDEIRKSVYLHRIRNINWDRYFKPWCVVPALKGKTCAQIVHNIEGILKNHERIQRQDTKHEMGPVGEAGLLQYIEIGKGVVFIHDARHVCQGDFFFLAALEKPMIWEREIARIFLMIHSTDTKNNDLSVLCYMISNWINHCRLQDVMEREWDYKTFMDSLCSMMGE